MPADPIDPGAMRTSVVTLSKSQLRQLADAVTDHQGSVRIEQLADAYTRVVPLGTEGEPIGPDRVLFPT